MIIFKFLLLGDVFKFKYLSKRANSIYFFVGKEKELFFLIDSARKIFDIDEYYEKFQFFLIEKLSFDLKKKFSFSKYLYLRSSLEEISREMTISNILFHLFYCPRSIFSKSDCLNCSRLFLKKELEVSFEFFENFNILSYLDSDEKEIQEFEFDIFWNNDQQKTVINSDIRRCLNTFIVQYNKQFLLLFLEIQFRIFSNFFHSLSKTFSNEKEERILFMKLAIYFVRKFALYILHSIRLLDLNNLFEEIEFDQFKFLKVINRKYKEELRRKYES